MAVRLQGVRPPATTGAGKRERFAGAAPKNHPGLWGQTGLREFQTFSVSTSFRRGCRMVRVGGVAGRPADMAKSSEWRTNLGRFWLRRGTGFAVLASCKDCAMPGTEMGESKSRAKGFPVPFCSTGLRGRFFPSIISIRLWRFAGMFCQLIPLDKIARIAKMLSEQLREFVNHELILRQKFCISLFGLVSNRLNNFDVKFRVAGYKLPKPLAANLDIIAFVLALLGRFAVATPINASHWPSIFVLAVNFGGCLEGCSHIVDLAAVAP